MSCGGFRMKSPSHPNVGLGGCSLNVVDQTFLRLLGRADWHQTIRCGVTRMCLTCPPSARGMTILLALGKVYPERSITD